MSRPTPNTPFTVVDMRADTKSKLLAEDAVDLSDAELHRVFGNTVLPRSGISDGQRAREAGVTMDDILLDALRAPMHFPSGRTVAATAASIWDVDAAGRGTVITTECVVDIDSGKVVAEPASEEESNDVDVLDRNLVIYNEREFAVEPWGDAYRLLDLDAFRAHLNTPIATPITPTEKDSTMKTKAAFTSIWHATPASASESFSTDCVIDTLTGEVLADTIPDYETTPDYPANQQIVTYAGRDFEVAANGDAHRLVDLDAFRAHLTPLPAYIEAYSTDDFGDGPEFAVLTDPTALCEQLQRLAALCQDNNMSEVRVYDGPDSWGPGNVAEDLRLQNPQLVVDGGAFWFIANPKNASYSVETRPVDIDHFIESVQSDRSGPLYFGDNVDELEERVTELLDDETPSPAP